MINCKVCKGLLECPYPRYCVGAIDMSSDPKIFFVLNFKFFLMLLLNWLAMS